MANRRSFKSDVSFLEKISIGAIGTHQVFEDLKRQGHNPLELERGSMSFKIWKTVKIKRIRVPDLLCVSCARRIESRAKTSLEISMSQSLSDPERSWDFGLDDEDFVALVACRRIGEKPIDWQADDLVQYVSVRALRTSQNDGLAVLIRPKGAEEGFESRVNWPTAIAHASGVVVSVMPERIQYRRQSDGRIISLRLSKSGVTLTPLVAAGEIVFENQFIGSVVPVSQAFFCDQAASDPHYLNLLASPSLSKRYTAAKALSCFTSGDVSQSLIRKLSDADEHIYVRLEAAASLARQENDIGVAFVKERLADTHLQHRLEAVIVLCEVATEAANKLLIDILLDVNQHPEIRAGAAWALGELRNKSAMSALIDGFAAIDEGIRIEAARALAKLASLFTPDVVRQLPQSPPSKRPGIAWALSKAGKFTLQEMLDVLVDEDARHWVAYIVGMQDQQRFIHEIELLKTKDSELYFAVNVLWKIVTSWVYGLEEY